MEEIVPKGDSELHRKKPESKREHVGWFTTTLIAHTDLELNAQKQTQYLKDDCLHFCIPEIERQY